MDYMYLSNTLWETPAMMAASARRLLRNVVRGGMTSIT
jgi:hypothetical protein